MPFGKRRDIDVYSDYRAPNDGLVNANFVVRDDATHGDVAVSVLNKDGELIMQHRQHQEGANHPGTFTFPIARGEIAQFSQENGANFLEVFFIAV